MPYPKKSMHLPVIYHQLAELAAHEAPGRTLRTWKNSLEASRSRTLRRL
jgi:hypothetical protein